MRGENLKDRHVVYERECGVEFNAGMNVLKVVPRDEISGCKDCFYAAKGKGCGIRELTREYVGRCESTLRTDGKNVKFIKVGELEYDKEFKFRK